MELNSKIKCVNQSLIQINTIGLFIPVNKGNLTYKFSEKNEKFKNQNDTKKPKRRT